MATPERSRPQYDSLHPSIDSDFRESQYDPKNIFPTNDNNAPQGFSVSNANKVVRSTERSDQRPQKRTTPSSTVVGQASGGNIPPSPVANLNKVPISKPVTPARSDHQSGKLRKGWAHFRGLTIGLISFGWTTCLWFTVQLPFSIAGAGALGAWFYYESEKTTLLGKGLDLIKDFLEFIGIIEGTQVFGSIFFISWAIVFAIGIISCAGVACHYLLAFLHPVTGNKSHLKFATLLVACVGYSVPLLNMFPWVWLYIFVMIRYPK